MKRILLIASFLMIGTALLNAQDTAPEAVRDTSWKHGGVGSINLTQAYYENWTAGGVPSIAGTAFFKAFIKYEKKKWRWDNQFDFAYGLINEREKKMQKTDDKIQVDSKLGYSLGNKWFASALLSFKTQFNEGYEDPQLQLNKISDFMSPAYVIAALGMDHNPNENLSLFLSPFSSKTTIVLDQALADRGAFGVKAAEVDYVRVDSSIVDSTFTPGENYRIELGAQLKFMYKTEIMTNVAFQTKLELFTNYFENFGNIDVNWEGLIEMKVNDLLSANIRVEVIYDDDIDISTGIDDMGVEHFGPRLQLKQLFGLGLSYRF